MNKNKKEISDDQELKLTDSFLKLVSDKSCCISKHSYAVEETFPDSPLNDAVPFTMGKSKVFPKCMDCDSISFDYCTNCNSPICKEHAYLINVGPTLFNICVTCKELVLKRVSSQTEQGVNKK